MIDNVVDVVVWDIRRVEPLLVVVKIIVTRDVQGDVVIEPGTRLIVASHQCAGAVEEGQRTPIGKLKKYVAKVVFVERAEIAILDDCLNQGKSQDVLIEMPCLFSVPTSERMMVQPLGVVLRSPFRNLSIQAFGYLHTFESAVHLVVCILCSKAQIT